MYTVDLKQRSDVHVCDFLGIKKPMREERIGILEKIVAWYGWNDIKLGYKKEYHRSSKKWDVAYIEYAKFMGLIAFGYRNLGMFSREVDVVWHSHQLNNPLYADFSDMLVGQWIVHVPTLAHDKRDPHAAEFFTQAYFASYGTLPPPIWGLKKPEGYCDVNILKWPRLLCGPDPTCVGNCGAGVHLQRLQLRYCDGNPNCITPPTTRATRIMADCKNHCRPDCEIETCLQEDGCF